MDCIFHDSSATFTRQPRLSLPKVINQLNMKDLGRTDFHPSIQDPRLKPGGPVLAG